jgi:hypothetical protein
MCAHPTLWRLTLGVFVLHTVQMAMWVVVPAMLVQAGLPKAAPLAGVPAGGAGLFRRDGRTLFPLERRGYLRAVLRAASAC